MLLVDLGLLITVGACVWLFFDLAGARGPLRRRLPFMGLAVCAALWACGEMIVYNAHGPTDRLVGRLILYTGGFGFPVFWLWTSSAMARPAWYRRAPWLVALALIPGAVGWIWLAPEMAVRFPQPERFGLNAGPVFWVWAAWGWGLVVVGVIQFLQAGRRIGGGSRKRLGVIGVAASLPLASELAYQIFQIPGPDPTPMIVGLCGIAVRLAAFDSDLGATLSKGQWVVFDQLRIGILLADGEGTIIDANPAALRLVASGPSLTGRALDDVLDRVGADPDRVIDVERVPLHRRLTGHVGWAVLLTDRTEATRLEEHLREQQRQESLGRLAGGLAHDFQNLLTSILAGAGLTRMSLEPQHPARKPLRDVVRGARTASRLTGQLLSLSGRGDFRPQPLSLSSELRDLEGLLAGPLPKAVALDLDLAPDLPAVSADRAELHQVAMNLVMNAAQAIEGTGLVRLRTTSCVLGEADLKRLVPGSPARPGAHVVLEVTDDGCGMDEETRERIFHPFFTTKQTGHGLGMAAALGIVHRHGGGIEVESEPGGGTRIQVFLPVTDARAEVPASGVERHLYPSGDATVLVVDDEDAVREVAAAALERVGYEVLRAEDGSEALEIFRDRQDDVDLVLLDLEMPGVGGLESWQALRDLRPDVRVVLSSAFRSDDDPEAWLGLAAGVLRKPYDVDELFACVRKALEGGRGDSVAV